MPMNRSGSKIPKVQVVLTIFPSPVMPDTSGVSLARKKKKKKKRTCASFWTCHRSSKDQGKIKGIQ